MVLPPLALYIHLPWCIRKCPYCDFNSHARPDLLPETAYIEALIADLESDLCLAAGRAISSIFIGGGTPSLFSAAAIARLLGAVRDRLDVDSGAEVTLEVNPGAAEQGRFVGYRDAGVTRLSVGAQTLDGAQLRVLGRVHDRHEAHDALSAALGAGFQHVNADLMYGLPGQSAQAALADVRHVLEMGVDHLSHYQLTVEPGTPFYTRPPEPADEREVESLTTLRSQYLSSSGVSQYEISAFAQPGAECRHNLNYWRFGDYLGIGAGAHGKITQPASGQLLRYAKVSRPRKYMSRAQLPEVVERRWQVRGKELVLEFMMNGLRLSNGVSVQLLSQRTGLPASAAEPGASLAREAGLLDLREDRFVATESGRNFLNELLAFF